MQLRGGEFVKAGSVYAGESLKGVSGLSINGPEMTDGTGRVVGEVIGSPAFYDQAHAGLCAWSDTHALAVHPTQIYDVIIQLALFALLMGMWRRRRFFTARFF